MIKDFFNYVKYKVKFYVLILSKKDYKLNNNLVKEYYIDSYNVDYFGLSFNNIIILEIDKKKYYFRQCSQHLKLNEFLEIQFANFFKYVDNLSINNNFKQKAFIKTKYSKDEIHDFKIYLNSLQRTKKFYRKILNIDYVLEKEKFSVWQAEKKYLSDDAIKRIGLIDFPEEQKEILSLFLQYMRGITYSYKLNRFTKYGNYEMFYATKSLASKKMADLLGIGNLIVDSEFVKIIVEDQPMIGILCESASGERALDTEADISPLLQRSLCNLNALDSISYQIDHYANNYNVILNNERIVSVCAFDNDNQLTFFPSFNINSIGKMGGSLLIKNGIINRPFFDRKLALKIMAITNQEIKKTMSPYLNHIQIYALEVRIKKLKKAIKKTLKGNPDFLIDDSEWDNSTINCETNGTFGQTYLNLFFDRHKLK